MRRIVGWCLETRCRLYVTVVTIVSAGWGATRVAVRLIKLAF